MKEQSFNERWETAMKWWKDSPYCAAIRLCAMSSLDREFQGSGQGISSSDLNHRVFSIWESYRWATEGGREVSVMDFLFDYTR